MTTKRRKRHSPEQIVRKLRDADAMLNAGKDLAAVLQALLDDTLVIWGGEFGRTPVAQPPQGASGVGRDHHINAFTMWMAGGGLKPGNMGQTDEFGFDSVEDRVEVHDLHATILHLMGFDHERLTYRYQGRDFRLTDVYGNVIEKMLAQIDGRLIRLYPVRNLLWLFDDCYRNRWWRNQPTGYSRTRMRRIAKAGTECADKATPVR